MKKLLVVLALLVFALPVQAEKVTLNATETIDSPVAVKMDWEVYELNSESKVLKVRYRWRDSENGIIYAGDHDGWRTWICSNEPDNPATPEDDSDMCFNEVFSFQVRAQDVGTPIGVGLRTLIWNRFKADILSEGNNGTFGQ